MGIRQQVETARELIRQGRYVEARALLVTIDHPGARQWIARIDARLLAERRELAPHQPPAQAVPVEPTRIYVTSRPDYSHSGAVESSQPWHPDSILSMIFYLTTVGAGIGFALNWRRLGKPQWLLPTLLATTLLPVISVVLMLVVLAGSFNDPQVRARRLVEGTPVPDALLVGAVAGLALASTFGITLALRSLQTQTYNRWLMGADRDSLRRFRPHLTLPAALVLGTAFAGAALVSLLLLTTDTPRSFANGGFSMRVAGGWADRPVRLHPDCAALEREPGIQCILFISDTPGYALHLLVLRVDLIEPTPAEELERASWAEMADFAVGERTLESSTIDGLPAVTRTFIALDASDPLDGRAYMRQTFVVEGTTAFLLSVSTIAEDLYRENREQLDAMFGTIRIFPGATISWLPLPDDGAA